MSSKARWVVLASYALILAVSQLLWLNFASLESELALAFHHQVSLSWIGMLTAIFPLFYVLFSIPSGLMVDRYGYRAAILWGALIMFFSAVIRVQGSFAALLMGQCGFALVQPLIVNSISKLVADWFEPHEVTLATGLGTVGMFVGMILGMGLSPVTYQLFGLRVMMVLFALVAGAAFLIFFLLGKERGERVTMDHRGALLAMVAVSRHKPLWVMCLISFLAIGVFNGLMNWLEPLLNLSDIQAGTLGALMIAGGLLGSIIIPALADRWNQGKMLLGLACALPLVLLYPLTHSSVFSHLIIFAVLLGFALLPGYALLLTRVEKEVGFEHAGAGTSLLMLAGNLGGILIIMAMQTLHERAGNWSGSVWLMMSLMFAALIVISVGLKERS